MVILDITKKDGSKCTRICDSYDFLNDRTLELFTRTFKTPHDDETIEVTIKTTIYNVEDVKEVKQYG